MTIHRQNFGLKFYTTVFAFLTIVTLYNKNRVIDMVEKYFDEELPTAEVGAWSERKYKLIELYSSMFTTSMKNKWDCRVYIDLFCGSGLATIKGGQRIRPTSPIIALDTNKKFDKYIFCDINIKKLDTLKQHVIAKYPNVVLLQKSWRLFSI